MNKKIRMTALGLVAPVIMGLSGCVLKRQENLNTLWRMLI